MAYLNVDDRMPRHPRIWVLSDAAYRLHLAGMGHCAEYLTDGRVEADVVPGLVPRFRPAALRELTARVGTPPKSRWTPICDDDGEPIAYLVEDYLDHNPCRDLVLARKAKAADRAAKSRASKGGME